MRDPRILLCMGTRPEIIKMAPVYHALRAGGSDPVLVHSGQHDEMAWPLYELFRMRPDHTVNLTRERPTLGHLGGRLMDEMDSVIGRSEADAVLVHGDTSSALMAAMAAYYGRVPVGHVEAGLRSFDDNNPFPEEKNRTLIAQLARWHFSPTEGAVRNLLDEGIDPAGIHCVGNTIVDAARIGLSHIEAAAEPNDPTAAFLARAQGQRLLLVTCHRRENWGRPLARIARTVRRMTEHQSDLHVIWPVHPNPIVRDTISLCMESISAAVAERIHLTGPLAYPRMLRVMQQAWIALTDSGGVQEEAAAINLPVLVARSTTERPELISAGGGALVGSDEAEIQRWVTHLREDPDLYSAMRDIENPYGDGKTGPRIASIIRRSLSDVPYQAGRIAA